MNVAMRFRACSALLILVSACATTEPITAPPEVRSPRLAHLQRAARYPWLDDGRCAVQEASQPWHVLVERCYSALDTRRVRFNDSKRRCPVASADAASVETLVGICLLSQPEIAAGAVIILGTVVVAVAIKEELDTYRRKGVRPEEGRPVLETKPAPRESLAERRPTPEPSGQNRPPPIPPDALERERRPDCAPRPVPRLGGNDLHNRCADRVPQNRFPGSDVLVNGKNFDALQLGTRTLWEIKTDDFDKHSLHSQGFFARMKLPEIQREKELAEECGYDFAVGVRSAAQKTALFDLDPDIKVVVMDWC